MIVQNAPLDSAVWTKAETVWNKPEAAEFLKIRPRTLDSWMRKGLVPFAKLPTGAVKFRRSQLLAFLAK